jgi:bifunctional DNase/RNase
MVKCGNETCDRPATDWFFNVSDWTCVSENPFCCVHAAGYWNQRCVEDDVRNNIVGLTRDGKDKFEFELWMVRSRDNDQFAPCLIDKSGHRHLFWWAIHYSDLVVLYNLLKTPDIARTTVYHFILQLAKALGGQLQSVCLESYDPRERQIRAIAVVSSMSGKFSVPIRPGDALLLSMVGKIPFLISRNVLEAHLKDWNDSR